MKKNLMIVVLCMICTLLLVGCKDKDNAYQLVQKGTLTVVTSSDFQPYEFVDLTKTGQDKYAGSDMSLARDLAKSMGVSLTIKAMNFDTILTALSSKKADLAISAISYDEDRAASYLFSSSSYFEEGDGNQVVVVKASDVEKYSTIESLNQPDVKVASQNGSIQQSVAEAYLPNANLIKVDDLNNAYTLLENGTYDAVVLAYTVASVLIQSKTNLAIAKEQLSTSDDGYYIVGEKSNTELMNYVNSYLLELNTTNKYQTWLNDAVVLFTNLGSNAGELVPDEE